MAFIFDYQYSSGRYNSKNVEVIASYIGDERVVNYIDI